MFRIVLIVLFLGLLLSVSPLAQATFAGADVEADFVKGELIIQPNQMYVTDGVLYSGRSRCIGLCFGAFKPSKAEKKQSADNTYMFLVGDPDNLTLSFLSFACNGPWTVGISYGYHTFEVLKGNIRIAASFGSGRKIVASIVAGFFANWGLNFEGLDAYLQEQVPVNENYYAERPEDFVNYACTSKFRRENAGHNIQTMAKQMGDVFFVEKDDDEIRILWDAEHWVDALESEARNVIQRAKILIGDESILPQQSQPKFPPLPEARTNESKGGQDNTRGNKK